MHAFSYHRPKTIDEAVSALGGASDPKLLAGGMTLLPTLKQRLAAPSDLIDLAEIGGLSFITIGCDTVTIGAMTRHATVAASAELQARLPALAHLADGIGDRQVRNRGTIGGSISNNDPAADYPSALVALDATVVTNERSIPAEQFFVGMFETALGATEIVREVRFRVPEKAAYAKFPNPASRYAVVGVFVAKFPEGVRVAVTGAAPSVFRVPEMEAALNATFSPDAVKAIHLPADGLNNDPHATSAYRANLVTVMAARAVAAC